MSTADSVSPWRLKLSSHSNCVSPASAADDQKYDWGRFFLLCLLTFFTLSLSPLPSSKWYFVVTKSHYSNVSINIYDEVWGSESQGFLLPPFLPVVIIQADVKYRAKKLGRKISAGFLWMAHRTLASINKIICQNAPFVLISKRCVGGGTLLKTTC